VHSKTSHLPACTINTYSSPLCAHYWPSRRTTYESAQGSGPIAVVKGSQGTTSTGPISLKRINVDIHTSHQKSLTTHTSRDSVKSTENQAKGGLDDPHELV